MEKATKSVETGLRKLFDDCGLQGEGAIRRAFKKEDRFRNYVAGFVLAISEEYNVPSGKFPELLSQGLSPYLSESELNLVIDQIDIDAKHALRGWRMMTQAGHRLAKSYLRTGEINRSMNILRDS